MSRPMPIPLQPDFYAVRDRTISALVRTAIATGHGTYDKTLRPADFARKTWGSEAAREVALMVRAASTPAVTSQSDWAGLLSEVVVTFLSSLVPASAGADLLSRGLQLRFAGAGAISLPTMSAGQAAFVGQSQPIPIVEYATTAGIKLEPHKLALGVTLTYEMMSTPSAEDAVRAALVESAAQGLDSVLFSTAAGTADQPAGLLNGITATTPSTQTIASEAMVEDLATLGGAIARVAGSNIAIIAAPEQAVSINLRLPQLAYPVLSSKALPKGEVIAVAANAVASAFEAVPRIESSREVAQAMDDSTPGTQPTTSVFQTDNVSLRLILPASWGLRASGALAYMTGVAW
jgi:hypothetical protein